MPLDGITTGWLTSPSSIIRRPTHVARTPRAVVGIHQLFNYCQIGLSNTHTHTHMWNSPVHSKKRPTMWNRFFRVIWLVTGHPSGVLIDQIHLAHLVPWSSPGFSFPGAGWRKEMWLSCPPPNSLTNVKAFSCFHLGLEGIGAVKPFAALIYPQDKVPLMASGRSVVAAVAAGRGNTRQVRKGGRTVDYNCTRSFRRTFGLGGPFSSLARQRSNRLPASCNPRPCSFSFDCRACVDRSWPPFVDPRWFHCWEICEKSQLSSNPFP